MGEVGDLGEERIVTAGGLRPALDDVARGDRARQPVVVGATPAVVCGGRPDDDRRVGDAAGDDDVRAGVQAVDDAPRSEVGVGRQRRAPPDVAAAAALPPDVAAATAPRPNSSARGSRSSPST